MFENEKLLVNELTLWDENARFPDNYNDSEELELIDYFISQPNFEINIFLDEIVADFDLPQIEKLVIWKDGSNYVVLEGNRRVTCYKLLLNPSLIETSHPVLYKKLFSLSSKIKIEDSFKVECLITEDKDQCYRFLDRKHNKNNNEVNWGDLERTNYSVRRGNNTRSNKIKVALSNYLKTLSLPKEIVSKVLGKGYVTTFFRLTTTGPAKEIFGLETKEDGSLDFKDPEFPSKLKILVHNVISKKDFSGEIVDSRELNRNEEIRKYLKSLNKANETKAVNEITKINKGNDNTNSKKKKKNINPKSSSRKTLIPKNCRIRINPTKMNNIYRELRDDLLLDDSKKSVPNAVGVLFRVFLELCLEHYAKKNGHTFKKNDAISKKISWVVKSLKDKGYDKNTFTNISKVGYSTTKESILSIHNFHEYVHSTVTQPSPEELKKKWENLQPFFELLWDDINK